MSIRRVVVDACVVLKWRLRDEEATAEADQLLADCLAGDLEVIAPALLDYEAGNALRVAAVRGRITQAEAVSAFTDIGSIEFARCPFDTTRSSAFAFAFEHNRSVYDAAYLALAAAHGVPLYTGDRALCQSVAARLQWVRWIGGYRLADVPELPENGPQA